MDELTILANLRESLQKLSPAGWDYASRTILNVEAERRRPRPQPPAPPIEMTPQEMEAAIAHRFAPERR